MAEEARGGEPGVAPSGSPRRVLVIEEDRVEGGMLAFHMRRDGLIVMLMTSEEEAVDAVGWAPPDAILVEARGRELDGFRFIRALDRVPVSLYLLADGPLSLEDDLEALRLGVADVFTKPLDAASVATRIKARPRPSAIGSVPDLPDGGISGDLSVHSLTYLLQFCHRHRLDARLHIELGGDWGRILVRQGDVIDAESPSCAGREAAHEALRDAAGTFVLYPLARDAEELNRDDVVVADLATLVNDAYGRDESRPPTDAGPRPGRDPAARMKALQGDSPRGPLTRPQLRPGDSQALDTKAAAGHHGETAPAIFEGIDTRDGSGSDQPAGVPSRHVSATAHVGSGTQPETLPATPSALADSDPDQPRDASPSASQAGQQPPEREPSSDRDQDGALADKGPRRLPRKGARRRTPTASRLPAKKLPRRKATSATAGQPPGASSRVEEVTATVLPPEVPKSARIVRPATEPRGGSEPPEGEAEFDEPTDVRAQSPLRTGARVKRPSRVFPRVSGDDDPVASTDVSAALDAEDTSIRLPIPRKGVHPGVLAMGVLVVALVLFVAWRVASRDGQPPAPAAAPQMSAAQLAQVTYGEALAAHQRGASADAERLFRQVVAADEDHVGALSHLSVIFRDAKRMQEAHQVLKRLSALRPEDPLVQANLGLALSEQGRLDDAQAAFDRALSLTPEGEVAERLRALAPR